MRTICGGGKLYHAVRNTVWNWDISENNTFMLCIIYYLILPFIHANEGAKANEIKKSKHLRYCQIQMFLNGSIGSELFKYLQNCKTYRTSVLTIKCVSFFSTNFVLNIFHSNKHLASYAPNIGRSIGVSDNLS
jgi:hypothetical protein